MSAHSGSAADIQAQRKKALVDRLAGALMGKSLQQDQKLRNAASSAARRGDIAKAKEMYTKAIEEHGKDDKSTLFVPDIYNEMGVLMCRSGRGKEAVVYLNMAVNEGTKIMGDSDRRVVCYEKNLAFAYKTFKQTKKAVSTYKNIVKKYTNGTDDPSNASEASYELASLLNDSKDFKAAEPIARKCLEWKKALRGSDIHTAPVLCLLAAIISAPDIAKFDEALNFATAALKITKSTSESWMGKSKDQETSYISKLIVAIRKGKQQLKRNKKKQKKDVRKKSKDSQSDSKASINTTPSAENLKRIETWKQQKLAAWEAGDEKLRKKCPKRADLDSWMAQQTKKALAALTKDS